jgi:hypothetical protein
MKRNDQQIEEVAHRMEENLCQLYIWQVINNQNIQVAQRNKTNEEMGKWIEQSFFQRKKSKWSKKKTH